MQSTTGRTSPREIRYANQVQITRFEWNWNRPLPSKDQLNQSINQSLFSRKTMINWFCRLLREINCWIVDTFSGVRRGTRAGTEQPVRSPLRGQPDQSSWQNWQRFFLVNEEKRNGELGKVKEDELREHCWTDQNNFLVFNRVGPGVCQKIR